jgi:hypothetical protein
MMVAFMGRPLPAVMIPELFQGYVSFLGQLWAWPKPRGSYIHENTNRFRWSVKLLLRSEPGA